VCLHFIFSHYPLWGLDSGGIWILSALFLFNHEIESICFGCDKTFFEVAKVGAIVRFHNSEGTTYAFLYRVFSKFGSQGNVPIDQGI
jgi:hypothetical protein